MSSAATFKVEREVFDSNKAEWSKSNEGQFVVIRGRDVAGFYDDYEAAFRAAVRKFGIGTIFLIKQIYRDEPIFYIY